ERKNIAFDTSMQKYLYNGFQFHFYNYAIPNANRSHWNIDYVLLDKDRDVNEAADSKLQDIGFINAPTSLLKDYQSMPWPHYQTSPSSFIKSSMTDSIRNIWVNPGQDVAYS